MQNQILEKSVFQYQGIQTHYLPHRRNRNYLPLPMADDIVAIA
jgi:hypothetical protein